MCDIPFSMFCRGSGLLIFSLLYSWYIYGSIRTPYKMTNQMFNTAWTLNQHFNQPANWRLSISSFWKPTASLCLKTCHPPYPISSNQFLGAFLVSESIDLSVPGIYLPRIEIAKTFWTFGATNLQLPEAWVDANTHNLTPTHTNIPDSCKTILENWNVWRSCVDNNSGFQKSNPLRELIKSSVFPATSNPI